LGRWKRKTTIIKLLVVILLSINFSSCSSEQNFYIESHKAIGVVEGILSEITIFNDKERNFYNNYLDKEGYTEKQQDFTLKLMRIEMEYTKELNFRNLEDPKNHELTSRLIEETKKLKEELELNFKE
jgi:hypothetical protein